MQKHDEAASRIRRGTVIAEQAHAATAIDDLGLGAREKLCSALAHELSPPGQFGHNRLYVAVAQTQWWPKLSSD
jgi:hypothetical protein